MVQEKKGLAKAKPPLILPVGVMRTATNLFGGLACKYNHQSQHKKWRKNKEEWQ